ncbi:Poly A polymerase head domain-containing protein [Flagellimonas taeanensis]|uniref:Poly A polymerase head domain-containing protein n=1 Tax=Flagellimonas taeanensis TaxID=1005926 RepID=A0A1M7CTZ9_9FLAO|nr:hypothetical protein [Allomuricauda taeanensis]SFC66083.1 Poly A polymerase head domain-containing protein [Allomuricauda taeanensis]SHL70732.1 Poly A polymerase head domain-containing protein [Allomuricauda taeanensis]
MDYNDIKSKFKLHFNSELQKNPEFKYLLYNIFVYGSAYIVGGYFRDFLNSKESRDLDIIIDLENSKLLEIINESKCKYTINRHKGIKLQFKNLVVDMWSIEHNWAFKNELVKLSDKDKLNSIAKGCFYNFDSLVINLHSFNLNIQNYLSYLENKKLDILLKSPIYKNLNPTTEANILRAFYLKKTDKIQFSSNTKKYLIDKIGQLRDNGFNPIEALKQTQLKYPKYQAYLDENDLETMIKHLYSTNEFDNQFYINF